MGFNEPVAGGILAKRIHQSPITIRGNDYVRLGVECEIAIQVSADLPAAKAPYSRDSVADAIGAAMAAFELIDTRDADYSNLAPLMLTAIADNALNAGVVLGPRLTDWRKVDLATICGAMVINGRLVGEGRGRDVMGHPLEALVWLANMLAKRGKSLTQDMIVMTGSIVGTHFLNPGDAASLSVDYLGEARLSVA